jgi:NAD(P)H-dependent flavin oxidoreductase YrpB (nitropropane dioxygenase family)
MRPELRHLPAIIRGGMGVGIFSWLLASAVARRGQPGVVSGVGLDTLLAHRIEDGDPGGHNAAPRGGLQLNERGEPIYGERDAVDLAKIRELGVPFWVAGGMGSPRGLRETRAAGAAGVQVGTLFAYCDESGMADELKRSVLAHAARGAVRVRTDVRASPAGYPFKIVQVAGRSCSRRDARARVRPRLPARSLSDARGHRGFALFR